MNPQMQRYYKLKVFLIHIDKQLSGYRKHKKIYRHKGVKEEKIPNLMKK